jgi:DNA-binding HxlR family transcriptional regulator
MITGVAACYKKLHNYFFISLLLIVILRLIMGATKSEIYTEEQNMLAVQLKAIAHPARIAILQELIRANACICGDLVTELGLAQATISQHLKELKNAGLIQGTIEGVSVCYCIEPKAWKLLQTELNGLFASYQEKDNCC